MSRGEILSSQRGGKGSESISLPTDAQGAAGGDWQLVVPKVRKKADQPIPQATPPLTGADNPTTPDDDGTDKGYHVEWASSVPDAPLAPSAADIDRAGDRAEAIARYNRTRRRKKPNP